MSIKKFTNQKHYLKYYFKFKFKKINKKKLLLYKFKNGFKNNLKILDKNKKNRRIKIFHYDESLINGILHIKASLNNVILTYTDLMGKPIYWYSCGRIPNIKKGSRSNYFIILETIKSFGLFLRSKNIIKIVIKFNGFGLIKKTLFKALKQTKLKVVSIHNITPLPHNGCRLKKYRRL